MVKEGREEGRKERRYMFRKIWEWPWNEASGSECPGNEIVVDI